MPAYGSQLISNSPLQQIAPGDPVLVKLFDAEIPVAGEASLAVAIQPRTISGGLTTVSIQVKCPLGLGPGVFQIQSADFDLDADYDSINFGGATPGQVVLASLNASGVGRVELQIAARFLRMLCVTQPSNPVTIRARQQ